MAYLTISPTCVEFHKAVAQHIPEIQKALQDELPKLGVAANDIVFRLEYPSTTVVSENHVEILLKTDNPRVTAGEIVRILKPFIPDIPFEVSRLPVGYGFIEFIYELYAYIRKHRRNWSSTYDS